MVYSAVDNYNKLNRSDIITNLMCDKWIEFAVKRFKYKNYRNLVFFKFVTKERKIFEHNISRSHFKFKHLNAKSYATQRDGKVVLSPWCVSNLKARQTVFAITKINYLKVCDFM
jgi:hypothetical protein